MPHDRADPKVSGWRVESRPTASTIIENRRAMGASCRAWFSHQWTSACDQVASPTRGTWSSQVSAAAPITRVVLTTEIDAGPRPPQQLIAKAVGKRLGSASEQMLSGLAARVEARMNEGAALTDTHRPDVVILMTDEERDAPPYESPQVAAWRRTALPGALWFQDNAVNFGRHYTGSLGPVCRSRPTIFTGHYPEVHGVSQTDGLGKMADDSRMRWLREGEVPTLGHWFRTAGYDTHYDGKWHISHADLHDADGDRIDTNDDDGNVLRAGVEQYRTADQLEPFGFSGWIGPEPHGGAYAMPGCVAIR